MDAFVVVEAIERAIRIVRAKHVVLSYSSGGRATAEELSRVISENGKLLEVLELGYKRNVMAGMRWTNDWIRDAEKPNREFLFLIEKRGRDGPQDSHPLSNGQIYRRNQTPAEG